MVGGRLRDIRDPAFHSVSSPPAAVASSASDMSEPSDPSDVPSILPQPVADPPAAVFDLAAPVVPPDSVWSLPLIQQRFASACPELEVFPLANEPDQKVHLAGKFLPEAMSSKVYAPGRVNGWRTMLCLMLITRDAAGTGTDMNIMWLCGIRLRPGADSSALDGVSLPCDLSPSFNEAMAERSHMPLRDLVKIRSGVCR